MRARMLHSGISLETNSGVKAKCACIVLRDYEESLQPVKGLLGHIW